MGGGGGGGGAIQYWELCGGARIKFMGSIELNNFGSNPILS